METINAFFQENELVINTGVAISLGFVAVYITWLFSKKSERLNNDALFHGLFRDFNTRYGLLNSYLKTLEQNSKNKEYSLEDLKKDSELYDKIIDYLNICAEEYYWFQQGRLDGKVWLAWSYGMNSWYKNIPILRELWLEEIALDGYKSYYLKQNENLFNKV
jgi:low affinity Fe/Cu permease